jgi:hypothetical protein
VPLPLVLRQDLVSQIPSLKKRFLHFNQYTGKKINDVFSPDQLGNSIVLNAYTFNTAVWLNDGKGKFIQKQLPVQAQFAPVYALLVEDFDKDGNEDILMGGNLYRAKPETGIYDGSYGLFLKGNGQGDFDAMPSDQSGVFLKGETRSFDAITIQGKKMVLVGMNNDRMRFLKY